METLEQKVVRLTSELEALNAQVPRNETQINLTTINLDDARAALEQEQAALVRIQNLEAKREQWSLPTDLNAFFSSPSHLDADGNPYIVTNGNRVVTQIVKDAIRVNDEEWNAKYEELEVKRHNDVNFISSQLSAAKAEIDVRDQTIDEKDKLIELIRQQLSQAIIEKEEAENKRDAAIREREEIKIKESDDLQQILAEEEAQKAKKVAEDRAKRTVYDVVGDSKIKGIESVNFTAKLAATGETITFNWMQKRYYIEITDPNEILQFRQQHSQPEPNQSDNAQDTTPVQDDVIPEVSFPDLPQAQAPNISGEIPVVVSAPESSGQGQITREEFENRIRQVKEEIKAEIVTQYGLVRAAS